MAEPSAQIFEILEPGSPVRPPLPRPGLGLAVLIVLGIALVHLVSTLAYLVVFVPELVQQAQGDSLTKHLSPAKLVQLLAFDQAMFVLVAFLATWWAFGSRFSQAIPFRLPAMRHVTLIFLLVLPLSVMDGFLAQQVIDIGENLFGITPSQGDLPELLDGVSKEASTGLLLLILAVMPALGEELVFRGVIGRGLIARYGIAFGILWTSILFSVVHGNPVQAVGVFFVGVMCHVSYLATRSLLAPILLHFLNNMLPVFALKALAAASAEDPVVVADQMTGGVHPLVALAAAACVAAIALLLWKSRVEDLDEDGLVVRGAFPSVEPPAAAVDCRIRPAASAWGIWVAAAYLIFLASAFSSVPA